MKDIIKVCGKYCNCNCNCNFDIEHTRKLITILISEFRDYKGYDVEL